MMRYAMLSFFVSSVILGGILFLDTFRPRPEYLAGKEAAEASAILSKKSTAELIQEAQEKSSQIKGLYMTADVANDQGAGGTRLRKKLLDFADTTEINGLVIDVKEVCGPDYNPQNLKKLLDELQAKNIWKIARIVVFKDASQIEVNPSWYLKRASPKAVGDECAKKKYLRPKNPFGSSPGVTFWQDRKGGYWLDPASPGAKDYILSFSKKMIDLGFDELQFDYLRFPSDGDVEKAIYPAWDGKSYKHSVMKSFFEFLSKNLKAHKPDIILSADLFGYVAINSGDVGIGQRLDDLGNNFDYLSFMVYPSHYYSGLRLPQDLLNNLPAINFTFAEARKNPAVVVERSLRIARDFLDGKLNKAATTSVAVNRVKDSSTGNPIASSTPKNVENLTPISRARLRPWLEDFFHEDDRLAGRPWGAEKIKLQIQGSEKVEKHGWLLWNASNIYTEAGLAP